MFSVFIVSWFGGFEPRPCRHVVKRETCVNSPITLSLYHHLRCYDKMIETTELFSMISLFWKHLEAHCFHYFLTDSPTKQSENFENSELPDPS